MRIFRNFDDARCIKNPVVTTGTFDGVHIGHRTILNRLRLLASKHNGESVLITFDPHPRKVLYPETEGKNLKLINSREEKLMLLEKAGLENLIIIEFTREFSKITSEEFVRDYLYNALKVKVVVAGFNHHFGFNKEGDYRKLWGWREKYHFEAEEIPEQEIYNETVSSTRIRKAICEGYIQRANAYLDSFYLITGPVTGILNDVPGDIPEWFNIKITDENKLLPPPGIYAASAIMDQGPVKCMVLVRRLDENKIEILAVAFAPESLTPGFQTTLYFHKKVHGALDFSNKDAITRIRNAKNEIEELIY